MLACCGGEAGRGRRSLFKVELGAIAIVLPSGIGRTTDRGRHCNALGCTVVRSVFLRESNTGMRAAIRNCFKTALPYLTHRAAEMVAISYVPTACFAPSFLSPCILVPFSVVRLGGIAARQGGTKSEHITPSMFGKRNFSPTR